MESPPRFIPRNAREHDRGAVGKFGDQREAPAHRLDALSERGEQQVASLLKPRYAVLRNPQLLRHPRLRQFPRLSEIAQRHLLGDQRRRPRLDLLALSGAQLFDLVVYVYGHCGLSRKFGLGV